MPVCHRHLVGGVEEELDGVIEAGRGLIGAKAELAHGEFEAMVEADLPFGTRTARMLMAVARDQRIQNRKFTSVLPASWFTLYQLTLLGDPANADDPEFAAAVETGKITPDLGQVEARALRTAERRGTRLAGVAPRFIEFDGDGAEILDWIVSRNLYRRHLSPSQKALIVAEIARPHRRGRRNDELAATAAALEVGERHAPYAQTVLDRAVPEVVERARR